MSSVHTFRPDSKGRICIGSWAKGVSSFHATHDEVTGKIILEPYVEIPAREVWLYENEEALAKVREGMRQAKLKMFKHIDLSKEDAEHPTSV